MRRRLTMLLTTVSTSVLMLLAFVPVALAENDGRGFYGATDDEVVTYAGFIVIAFFPLFVFTMSMIQRHLEKRKEAAKTAKKHLGAADYRGGW